LLRLLKSPRNARLGVAFGLAAALVLYTHYTPGAAIALAAIATLLIRTRSLRPLIIPNVVLLLAYSPWIASSKIAISRWGNKSDFYRVTGSAVLEEVVKLGYWSVSLLFGESIPWWLFLAEIPLGIALLWLAWRGLASAREWLVPLALVAILGYLSVSRWVTYPFIPARMLFLAPFFYLLLAYGLEARPAAGRIILSTMLLTSALGLWSYFHVSDFLNWGYAVPYPEISKQIAGSPRPTLVAAPVFTDSGVLHYFLPSTIPFHSIRPQANVAHAAEELSAGPWSRICVVRNTHDASPGAYYIRLEEALGRNFPHRETYFYRPRTRLDTMLMSALGWKDAVPYFYEVVELER
jgi:hypothetical protein